MHRVLIPLVFWLGASLAALAQPLPEDIDPLARALGLPQIIEVMRDEGLVNGSELAEEMFPGRGGPNWQMLVEKIYDIDWMTRIVWSGLAAELEGQ